MTTEDYKVVGTDWQDEKNKQPKCINWVCEAYSGLYVQKLPQMHSNSLTQTLVVPLTVPLREPPQNLSFGNNGNCNTPVPGLIEPR